MKKGFKKLLTFSLCLLIVASNAQNAMAQGILTGKKVILDAGHGGTDPGAVSKETGLFEKNVNLALTKKVAKLLSDMGAEILYTRNPNNDEYIDLIQRADIANASGANLFVSIHHDSSVNSNATGISTHYSSYRAKLDVSDAYVLYNGVKYPFVKEERENDIPYIYYDNNGTIVKRKLEDVMVYDPTPSPEAVRSGDLAKRMYDKVMSLGFSQTSYVRDHNLYVTRQTTMPSVLIEAGFMSNLNEIRRVTNPEFETQIAEKIVESMREYFVAAGEAKPFSGDVNRLAGIDRYETGVKISQSGWTQSENVIIATGRDFPDALSATPLAKLLNAPILLTYAEWLDEKVADEIKRLGAKNVYIIGAEGVMSKTVENQLTALGVSSITRLAGKDRYETSVKVAEEVMKLNPAAKEAVVTVGENFPDALSMAPIAAKRGMPILLTYNTYLPDVTKAFLNGRGMERAYMLGSSALINDVVKSSVQQVIPAVERIWGSDRYATNAAILNKFKDDVDYSKSYVATGEDYPDALTGSALASLNKAPIILTDGTVNREIKQVVMNNESEMKSIYIFGTNKVVGDSFLSNLFK